jgi:hypothetical protein
VFVALVGPQQERGVHLELSGEPAEVLEQTASRALELLCHLAEQTVPR